jgi:hypothetical protein
MIFFLDLWRRRRARRRRQVRKRRRGSSKIPGGRHALVLKGLSHELDSAFYDMYG